MSDLALFLEDPCLDIGGPGMYPPVADLMYLSSGTAGELDLVKQQTYLKLKTKTKYKYI